MQIRGRPRSMHEARHGEPPKIGRFRLLLGGGIVLCGLATLFFACAEGGGPDRPLGHQRVAPVEGARELLGSESCLECHGHQPAPRHHRDCEGCHGSGERHVEDPLISEAIRHPANADCLDCHQTGHRGLLDWELSEHRRAGLLCSDCHEPHNAEPLHLRVASDVMRNVMPHARGESRLCVSCHMEVAAQLNLPSHHPVKEGMLGCSDCHAPHAGEQTRLGAQTDQCTQCHQAQAGPWIYDHTPVVEDCGHCHVPHGASADALLVATQPGACVYCHTVAEMGATHDPQAYVTRCTDCHGAVHGSYADPHLRR
ncbi:MAG: hypothetical protein JRF61_22295 [Deltaproteobacteria bacterium]|jgi:DmsE family decaheme c-type cytochrome|nr:hypothetical protein [Deltaproteobacteria bacterium]